MTQRRDRSLSLSLSSALSLALQPRPPSVTRPPMAQAPLPRVCGSFGILPRWWAFGSAETLVIIINLQGFRDLLIR